MYNQKFILVWECLINELYQQVAIYVRNWGFLWGRAPSGIIQSQPENLYKLHNPNSWRKTWFWILHDGNLWFHPLPGPISCYWLITGSWREFIVSVKLWDVGPKHHCCESLLRELNMKKRSFFPKSQPLLWGFETPVAPEYLQWLCLAGGRA